MIIKTQEPELPGFEGLHLIEPILKALRNEGYTTPTPIQEQAIPHVLAERDLLGAAQTGTGKTAAFSIPILQLLTLKPRAVQARHPGIRVLILTPTRELAIQIGESISAYGKYTNLKHTVIFGGVPQRPQEQAVRQGVDILVATPGRLLDLMSQHIISLKTIEIFVLDEADRMLDMGFIHDIRKVIDKLPTDRQSLFFSATMPPEIKKLADTILRDPVQVEVNPVSSTAEKVEQHIYFVEKADKRSLLKHLLEQDHLSRVLVFTRTKHGADKVVKDLHKAHIDAEAIHGNKSQNARQRALGLFKSGDLPVLVATDIAARGIDVDEISHVINYDLPNEPETYVHRIGRTGRASASGTALSFCDVEERAYLKDIQKLIKQQIPVVENHPYVSDVPMAAERPAAPARTAEKTKSRGGNASGRSGYWRNRKQQGRDSAKK
jgi:ATP-dependent RNA helicase RhlE